MVATDEAEDSHEGLKLSGANTVAQELEKMAEVRSDYTDVLREEPGELKGDEIEINTGDSPPIRSMPSRLCPAWRAQVKDEIDQLLRGKIIEPGKGPWSSPIVLVRKPDGSIRLCVDFRKLNAVTTPDPYCIPMIEDLLDQVGTSTFLSKIDLSKGFYQIPVKVADRDKTSFVTPFGKYRFR